VSPDDATSGGVYRKDIEAAASWKATDKQQTKKDRQGRSSLGMTFAGQSLCSCRFSFLGRLLIVQPE
jgi:hypothetical protein